MMANASRTPIVRAMLVSVDGAVVVVDVVVDVVDDSDHDENDEDHEVGIVDDVDAIDDCADCVVVVEFAAAADVNASVVDATVV